MSLPAKFVVAIPARNECERLPHALAAIDRAAQAIKQRVEVLVFANNCTDSTVDVGRGIGQSWQLLNVTTIEQWSDKKGANAGWARRAAVEHAFALFEPRATDILLSTDADACFRVDAFHKMINAFAMGADLVLAKIECVRDPFNPASDAALAWGHAAVIWRHCVRRFVETVRTGRLAPYEMHDDYGGAGIAISVDAYRRLGGFSAVPSQEDLLLVQAADRLHMNVNRQSGAIVEVSTRTTGRAHGGMADALMRNAESARRKLPCLVEHHRATMDRVLRQPCHANAFARHVSRTERAVDATAALQHAMARYGYAE